MGTLENMISPLFSVDVISVKCSGMMIAIRGKEGKKLPDVKPDMCDAADCCSLLLMTKLSFNMKRFRSLFLDVRWTTDYERQVTSNARRAKGTGLLMDKIYITFYTISSH